MAAITGAQLRELFPHALDGYVQAIAQGGRFFEQYGVTTPLRQAHFLAQCAAETGGFTITEESGNYSAARMMAVWPNRFSLPVARAYAHKPKLVLSRAYANRLGNGGELSGDGWRYRGRGMIQLTGRENYAKRSAIAGVDLVQDPDKAADCFISLKIALQEWIDLGLSDWADKGPTHEAVLACARGINCGSPVSAMQPNGLDNRRAAFDKIWKAIGDGSDAAVNPAADGILEEGEHGLPVLLMQQKLSKLGYDVGWIDGIFGERTKAAVVVFQEREQLTGERGKWLMGAYDDAADKARPFSNANGQQLTKQGLLTMNDAQTVRTQFGKRVAAYAAGLTVVGQGVAMVDVNDLPAIAQSARAIVEPVLLTLRWGLAQNQWVLAALGFAAVWVIFDRTQAHHVADMKN